LQEFSVVPEVGLEPTRGCGALPNETSASTLATEIMLRSSEEWALMRYLSTEALEEAENLSHNIRVD
jgi:hypothetical protein